MEELNDFTKNFDKVLEEEIVKEKQMEYRAQY